MKSQGYYMDEAHGGGDITEKMGVFPLPHTSIKDNKMALLTSLVLKGN